MDLWGFLVFIVGAAIYHATKKNNPNAAKIGIYIAGIGTGIVIAAGWAVQNVTNALP